MKSTYSISFLLMAILGLSFALSYAQNPEGERRILVLLGGGGAPAAHATSHTDGSDDIQDATAAQKGLATATQITKLDGIEASATADQTDGEIKTAYENNADTNAFTDAEQTKLGGIETGAQVDQTITLTGDITGSGTGSFVTTVSANVIGLAELAPGTDGNLYTFNSSGDPAFVLTGSSGEVLTSNGVGTAPTFQVVNSTKAFLQIRRTTSFALTCSFGTVSFDATDHESCASVIEHNNCCAFKVDLKVNGFYYVQTGGHVNFTSACGASAQYGHRFLLCCVVQDGSNHPLSPIASICNFTFGGAIPGGFFVEVTSAPSVLTFEMDETGGNVNLSAGLTWTIQQK